MPKPLIVRLVILLVVAVAAHLYFRREAAEQIAAAERAAHTAPPAAPAPREPARASGGERIGPCEVTHVTDGDTLNVRCAGRKERVRLLQIDTPERDEPLYDEAGNALDALIAGRAVELERGEEERDDHGRLLAYVWIGEEHLNLAMIRAGWSPYFDRYGAGRYPREFAEAEREARSERIGIWASE